MFNPRLLPILLIAICLAAGAGCASSDDNAIELNDKSLQITPKAYGDATPPAEQPTRTPAPKAETGYAYGNSGRAYNADTYGIMGGVSQDAWTQEEVKAASLIYSSPVYFHFDRADLTDSAKEVLRQKAEIIKNFPQLHVIVAGHSDERGSNEYNFELSKRRALAAFKYLTDQGVNPRQLSTVSYGKTHPAVTGSNEKAWSLNRRVEFLVAKPQ